jgi:adenine-specific DNA methylase
MIEQTTFNFSSKNVALGFSPKKNPSKLWTYLHLTTHQPPVVRPIHYLGSKLRIVEDVRQAIGQVDPSGGPVCDLFSGSGTVSRELSKSRNVIAVDVQEYSRVLCSALLNPSRFSIQSIEKLLSSVHSSKHSQLLSWAIEPMIAYEASCRDVANHGNVRPLAELLEHGSIFAFQQGHGGRWSSDLLDSLKKTTSRLKKVHLDDTASSLATRYFGGVYFSYFQASVLDLLLEAVGPPGGKKRDTLLAAILSTTSDVVNTVGKQFAQPIRPCFADGRPKPDLARRIAKDRDLDVLEIFMGWISRYLALPETDRKHEVLRCDYEDALKNLRGKVSVVYADPPYTRDHYSRFYHILETFCLRDCPTVSMVRTNGKDSISRGMYRIDRHQSPFCIMSLAPKAFLKLFAEVRRLGVPLVLSYSPYSKETGARPRSMQLKEVTELAKKSFKVVEVVPAGRIAHSKLNRSDMNKTISYGAEYFIMCMP